MYGPLERHLLSKFHICIFPIFNVGWVLCLLFGVMVIGFQYLYLLIINFIIIATCMSRIPVRWLPDLGLSCWGLGSGFNIIILLFLLPVTAKEKWTPSKPVCSYSPMPPQCRWTVPSVLLYKFSFLSQRQLMEKNVHRDSKWKSDTTEKRYRDWGSQCQVL